MPDMSQPTISLSARAVPETAKDADAAAKDKTSRHLDVKARAGTERLPLKISRRMYPPQI